MYNDINWFRWCFPGKLTTKSLWVSSKRGGDERWVAENKASPPLLCLSTGLHTSQQDRCSTAQSPLYSPFSSHTSSPRSNINLRSRTETSAPLLPLSSGPKKKMKSWLTKLSKLWRWSGMSSNKTDFPRRLRRTSYIWENKATISYQSWINYFNSCSSKITSETAFERENGKVLQCGSQQASPPSG